MNNWPTGFAFFALLAVLSIFANNATATELGAESGTESGGSIESSEIDDQIRIIRGEEQPAVTNFGKASGQHYTGLVQINQSFKSESPATLAGESVTFEPGARLAWHTNPMGQTVIIMSGKALVQEENGPIEVAWPGDVVWFPPKVKHWFGAVPDTAMTSLVIAEAVNGQNVNWLEKVVDAEYNATASTKKSKHVTIARAGSQPFAKANPKNFTGSVHANALFNPQNGSRAYGAVVTFEPCARTDWHSHPMGQTLIVTAGRGYVQKLGGPVHEIHQGDIALTPANVVHWHGAAPHTAMAHIALSERIEGKAVAWGPKVSDQEYGMINSKEMPMRLQKIALIAAFTASGDMEQLKTVLVEGLEAGLTVNEIKEVLIHTYAYAGFPRALNGINAFMAVMDVREKQGIKDVHGPQASPVPTTKSKYQYGYDVLAALRNATTTAPKAHYETFAPTIEVFLKEHLFADIFMRDVLDYRSREIATVGVLSNLPGTNVQLHSHIGLAMNQGVTAEQLRQLFTVMGSYLGKERENNALAVLKEVLDSKK